MPLNCAKRELITTLVLAGGAVVVECMLEVPGCAILVDRALAHLERSLVGFLVVQSAENLEVFRSGGREEPRGRHLGWARLPGP